MRVVDRGGWSAQSTQIQYSWLKNTPLQAKVPLFFLLKLEYLKLNSTSMLIRKLYIWIVLNFMELILYMSKFSPDLL